MQIKLNEQEISEAVAAYVAKKNPSISHIGAIYVHSSKDDIHVLLDVITEQPKPILTFASIDTWPENTDGTCLQGHIEVTYKELVEKLGEPKDVHDDYKSDAEWWIKFGDGTFATVYNYKDGKNYNGDDGEETEDITDWHIGGKDQQAVKLVNQIFGRKA